jgi:dethiobiotin synthetase
VILVLGPGPGVGKTHLGCALLRAAGATAPTGAYKPIESGVAPGEPTDAARLEAAATFHVKPSRIWRLRAPLAPTVAARREGVHIRVGEVLEAVREARKSCPRLVVELAGGLFSPQTEDALGVDLAADLANDGAKLILVAPNRLGAVHDVIAAVRAAPQLGFASIVLSGTEADAEELANRSELMRILGDATPVQEVPRASEHELAANPVIRELATLLPLP